MRRNQHGFTITELLVVLGVAAGMVAILFTVTFNYYVSTVKAEVATQMALESQSLLTQLTEDVRLADAITDTNVISDSNNPGGWTTNDPSNIIIIQSPATDTDRDIIYDNSTGYPFSNEFVYFLDGNSMYKRILANAAASGNTAVTTCPSSVAGPSCPQDKLFSNKITNLTFTFYDINDVQTALAAEARSVLLAVNMEKEVYGETITLNNSTRITMRNQ
jgi:prepilin-type N-terminal cleavage/methylation domain-containing protein